MSSITHGSYRCGRLRADWMPWSKEIKKAIAVALEATLFRNISEQLVGQKVILSHPSVPGEILTLADDRLTFAAT